MKFDRLWQRTTSGYESHSEADMALCALLAFWTGGDEEADNELRGIEPVDVRGEERQHRMQPKLSAKRVR